MSKKILVLDDDVFILSALQDVLEYYGYEVKTQTRGDKVFEQIEEYHPDLILLDVMLAEMDGREICRNIKEKPTTAEIPVILISATHNLADCLNQQLPPDDFVPKPFDIGTLMSKIEHQLAA
ncbi:response regulator [Mucilaginibacter sp. HMF5004]|uniref:response regulator transcription factor n=1 Tax=Mucilaginibacter rivuli TaxID=2857527 RepID=UPI001C5DC417|nr:response regulator [Mucilaginibacter rivuli]MBW4888744.1 response regulator [Mucilaginibacter rivuli]